MQVEHFYLRHAYNAAQGSPDPSNQVGAVVVDIGGYIRGRGCNNFPRRIKPELVDREAKLKRIQHAERAALFEAFGTEGSLIMFAYWAACCYCAQDILSSPVTDLYVHKQRMDMTPERWKADVDYALGMLREGGISVHYFDGRIPGGAHVLVDGKLWSPESLEFV